MKGKTFKALLVMMLVLVAGTVFASAKPKKVEERPTELKQVLYTTEIKSENSERKVVVEYEERYGKGNAHYIIKDKNDKLLGDFYSDVAPYIVIVPNKGKSLIAWGGYWQELPICGELVFFDFEGNVIKKYGDIGMPPKDEIAISDDSKNMAITYALYVNDYSIDVKPRVLAVFSLKTGKVIKKIPLKKIGLMVENSLAISNNANWILIAGKTGKDQNRKIILLNKNLRIKWTKEYIRKNHKGPRVNIMSISKDGRHFEIKEIHEKNKKYKVHYANNKGQVKRIVLEKGEVFKKGEIKNE